MERKKGKHDNNNKKIVKEKKNWPIKSEKKNKYRIKWCVYAHARTTISVNTNRTLRQR